MEYVYSALVLHAAGKEITEDGVANVLKAAGVEPDMARVKALVAALDGVDIEDAISKAVAVPAAGPAPAAPAGGGETPAAETAKKEEEKEEEEVSEEEAAAGLGALFG
ncbi:MAG: 50S ribosomal protein P1 [Thermoplasmata archaeon]|nr:50S ribosomal protein P1 [Thermoplasmata archaeon]